VAGRSEDSRRGKADHGVPRGAEGRVPAAEIETLITDAVRKHLGGEHWRRCESNEPQLAQR
jgi:hypothetical protein